MTQSGHRPLRSASLTTYDVSILGAGIRRRDFIKGIVGSAASGPLSARAQQPGLPVIGFFYLTSPELARENLASFRRGLEETGYIEGRNVAIEYLYAHG